MVQVGYIILCQSLHDLHMTLSVYIRSDLSRQKWTPQNQFPRVQILQCLIEVIVPPFEVDKLVTPKTVPGRKWSPCNFFRQK